jgi:hypothetical protein
MKIVASLSQNHRRCLEIKSRKRHGKVKKWRVMHIYQCTVCRGKFPEIVLHDCQANQNG